MEKLIVARTFCKGVAVSKVLLIRRPDLRASTQPAKNPETELGRFSSAVTSVSAVLALLAKQSSIFSAHLELVQDCELRDGVETKICLEGHNAEQAVESVIAEFASVLDNMDDDYMRARAADIRDIGLRLMRELKGIHGSPLSALHQKAIIVAQDLLPSDTADMDFRYVEGFITEEGGVTSHVAIIARSYGIPALVGAEGILKLVQENSIIAMDAGTGEVIVDPDAQIAQTFLQRREDYLKYRQELAAAALQPSVSSDGHTVRLCANVGSLKDIDHALPYMPDGIGLFRTELIYMQQPDFPSEETQFMIYRDAALRMQDKELIIRTLDIGGDKGLPYFDFGREENPFLGYRAIRVCLQRPDIFKVQLRALLRASAFGNLKIMYPMMISLEELEQANALLETCKQELRDEGKAFREQIAVGMMMETPAAVLLADMFAKRVSFFSIGTNDLTQYILAIDRGNKQIAAMYNSFHPAVIRSIATIINAAHKYGIPVGMCGEFASDETAFPLLLALGLDEFSMAADAIAERKLQLNRTSFESAKVLAEEVLEFEHADELRTHCTAFYNIL